MISQIDPGCERKAHLVILHLNQLINVGDPLNTVAQDEHWKFWDKSFNWNVILYFFLYEDYERYNLLKLSQTKIAGDDVEYKWREYS